MARARRLAAAGAVTAFTIGGLSMAAGIGTASADSGGARPATAATCLVPLLPCETASGGHPGDPWEPVPDDGASGLLPVPGDSRPGLPIPHDSWSSAPSESRPSHPEQEPPPDKPWQPVDEERHRWPDGPPQTGGGGLAPGTPAWPFAVGGAALLVGAGLTGFAVRRGRGVA
ncbi:hypothetical protein [Thermoactinospora rubra]|uniref:hypothetical protein n=1 Tax=Thermoactinospora rubra TaxID=1088767 RepID=UPI0011816F4F|nr:hypothetical protein [Thermoactinospora rubra]